LKCILIKFDVRTLLDGSTFKCDKDLLIINNSPYNTHTVHM